MADGFNLENGILTKYEGTDAVVVIPEGVTQIGDSAFQECKTLTELVMPDSVTGIGKYAFKKCVKLKSVVFSKALTAIGYEAFRDCKALKELSLPDTLRTVEGGAFAGCVKLSKVACDSKVYEAGSNPFHGYQAAECKLMFDQNGFLVFINTLYQYNGNDEVVRIPDGVTHIAGGVFRSETYSWGKQYDMKKVILPESVTHIGRNAFANCAKLEAVEMPADVEIGAHAFDGCTGLADEQGRIIMGNTMHAYLGSDTVVEIPAGVERLAECLFVASEYGANSANKMITKVVLPEGLKHIGAAAFRGCASLEEIHIPESVKTIGEGAFLDCTNLAKIQVPQTTAIMDQAFGNCKRLADENGFIIINGFLYQCFAMDTEIVVPDHVKAIGSGSFNKLRIKKISLPEGLTDLGAAFDGCAWLEEIIIPEGVTEISPNTFSGCTALKKVKLPGTITSIGRSAFSECAALEEVQIPEGVTYIGEYAFERCKALKALSFPGGVKRVPKYVCAKCDALESVVVADGVEGIEPAAFMGCTALKQIYLPESVGEIGYSAFADCTGLERVEIRNQGCRIPLTAFHNCPKLFDANGMKIIAGILMEYIGEGGEVVIPDSVVEIAPNVFREGTEYQFRSRKVYRPEGSLREVVIPASVKTIRDHAFSNCKALSKVTIADGVAGIGANAFSACEVLSSITIPASVVSIGQDAFRGCTGLKDIFVEGGNPCYGDVDGVLYNAEKTALLYYPAGKRLVDYTVADSVCAIGDHAFIDCQELTKVVIPASVKEIGNEVFVRDSWMSKPKLKDIQIAVGAGSSFVGEAVIDFPYGEQPLVYPNIPVLFPKEQTVQVRLALGFCQSPEKYSGEYAEEYRKYAKSHQKTLLKKATQLKLKAVEDYFASDAGDKAGSGYKPDLKLKKPSELQKVEILEEVVLKGTLEDLKAVLDTYKKFEMTARAMGLAARYRGVDFVRALADHGATFRYASTSTLQRKYAMDQTTAGGCYSTEYYLMLVPEKLTFHYDYTPMCGVAAMNISQEQEAKRLPMKDRLEVVKYLAGNKTLGVSLDEMLFWALTRDELEFADALIAMGTTLNDTPPSYYTSWGTTPTYLDIITNSDKSVYWTSYLFQMTQLTAEQVMPVFARLHKLAHAAGKKLTLSQKMFEEMKWTDETLAFAVEHFDLSKVTQKKALETAASVGAVSALAKMADAGWLAQPAKREKLIEFARDNQQTEALAWLMDFKNRTVDVAAEEAKAEAKMLRELTENPNSVSALKKIWGYKKREDGTLEITNYKGSSTEVVIPDKIGKAAVSAIGEDAFSCSEFKKSVNKEVRKSITSVVVPEGITEIGAAAFFGCESLRSVSLPSTLKTIGAVAFRNCKSLEAIEIPKEVNDIGHGIFWGCDKLFTGEFLILSNILFACSSRAATIEIPKGVTRIAPWVFKSSGFGRSTLKNIVIPDTVEVIEREAFAATGLEVLDVPGSVKRIEKQAFYECKQLKEIHFHSGLTYIGVEAFAKTAVQEIILPETVTEMGSRAFDGNSKLIDIFVPAGMTQIGDHCFSWPGRGKHFHTTEGAFVVKYIETYYPDAVVFYDYKHADE